MHMLILHYSVISSFCAGRIFSARVLAFSRIWTITGKFSSLASRAEQAYILTGLRETQDSSKISYGLKRLLSAR